MDTDLTFITNEEGKTLEDRFKVLIKDSKFFDCLVGYFYLDGFYLLYPALGGTDKIRILIGIGTGKETYRLIKEGQSQINSHYKIKQEIENSIKDEMEYSNDSRDTEEGIKKFIEWIRYGKLEIRAYPSQNIHAKLYIVTFSEGDRDVGRVITGSSNFTEAGLVNNLEFNVELKNRADYEFAKSKFEELWKEAVDVSEEYVRTIEGKTWFKQDISPYELYLKFLYEYFKDELSQTDDVFIDSLPEGFKRFEYQEQAVLNAKKILEEYGGVFISDVVGLGKTYIATMLVKQLDGRTLIIAPPTLLSRNNPGSWVNACSDFNISADYCSIGKLDGILERGVKKYKNIIIDEAHRFRRETTISYEKLSEICRGKRVILVTATPYNNSPDDILSQIKLFQNAKKSNIPGLPNLEEFFKTLDKRTSRINLQKEYDKFLEMTRENARIIRERVLKYLMVRRTRAEIEKYFAEDLKKNGIKFPEVKDPIPLYYQLNEEEDKIFMETVRLITQDLKYTRYTPLLYYKKKISPLEKQSQMNMGSFMKALFVKRLESSFHAFRRTINRVIRSYEIFIKEYENGNVFISKKYINKIFELLENDDDEEIQRLIDEGKAERKDSKDFKEDFIIDLKDDLKILRNIKSMWEKIERDPKLNTLIKELKINKILQNKVIIFTESKETAEYLEEKINEEFNNQALLFTGASDEAIRNRVIENFDARAKNKKDDYRILISTEILSEGVNLHRSNIVINYDIPWNPTRMMQRVGRVNRIDTPFETIYTLNFFPTKQANDEIKLKEIAQSKIEAFLTLLGGDASILTEGEPVGSHELFNKLISRKTLIEGPEEESELKYLSTIKNVRDNTPDLFEKIKQLPKKARSAKKLTEDFKTIAPANSLLTFFRKGKLMKFFLSSRDTETKEIDFISSAKILESSTEEKSQKLPEDYYDLLEMNKNKFVKVTSVEEISTGRSRGNDTKLLIVLKILKKNNRQLTEDQEEYIKRLEEQLMEGAIPKKTVDRAFNKITELGEEVNSNPLKILAILQSEISRTFLESHYAEELKSESDKREVILSMYLVGGKI